MRLLVLALSSCTACFAQACDSGGSPRQAAGDVAAASASPGAPPPSDPPRAVPAAPDRFALYRLLMTNATLPLASGKHCDGVVGAPLPGPATLGDWVAYNLSLLDHGHVELPTSCRREGSAWQCDVEFMVRHEPENLLWKWGVRLRVSDAGRDLEPGSLVCIGSG